MIQFVADNLSTIITAAVLFGILAFIFVRALRNSFSGKGCSCSGCGDCSAYGSCDEKNN